MKPLKFPFFISGFLAATSATCAILGAIATWHHDVDNMKGFFGATVVAVIGSVICWVTGSAE